MYLLYTVSAFYANKHICLISSMVCRSGSGSTPRILNSLNEDDDMMIIIIVIIIIYSFIKMQHKMTMYNWRTGHARLGKSS